MADINLGVGGANSAVAGGYEIDNSVKIEADNAEVFKRTYGSGGNVQKWTFSVWYKRTELTGGRIFGLQTGGNTFLQFASDKLRWYVGGNDQYTEAVYRDTSAWYHIVLQFDTTQATASNRTKIYVNGVQQTLTGSYVNQYTSSIINSATTHGLGGNEFFNSEQVNGYMAEVHFVDGQALEPSDFGEYDEDSGIWKPKEYEGTYGTTGWYLDFEDAANLGDDVSGNNNHWTETNITAADQATDTPTNNFCTMAGLWEYSVGNRVGVDGGTTTAATNGGYAWQGGKGTMGVTNGKWYFEFTIEGGATGFHTSFFVGWQTESMDASGSAHNTIGTIAYYGEGGGYIWVKDNTSGRTLSVTGSTTYGDIYGVALDLDSNPQTVIFYRNGSAITSNITLGSGLSNETLFPFESTYYPQEISRWNFGGYTAMSIASGNTDENGYGNFEYAPPSGYYALCTKNLAEYG
jgi:hypothetical protein